MIIDAHYHLYDHGAILKEIEGLPISESDGARIVRGNFMDLVGGKET